MIVIDDRLETSIYLFVLVFAKHGIYLFVLVFAKHGTRYAGETMVSVLNSSHSMRLGISNQINCNQLFRLLHNRVEGKKDIQTF